MQREHLARLKRANLIPPNHLTMAEFAKLNGITTGAVSGLVHNGKLQYVKIGIHRFIENSQKVAITGLGTKNSPKYSVI